MRRFNYKNSLDLGNQLAESDQDFLAEHFVSIVTSRFVGKPTTSIIVGRKGAGKSALRLHCEKSRDNKGRVASIEPSGTDLIDVMQYIVGEEGSKGFAVEPIVGLWELTAYLNIARLLKRSSPAAQSHLDCLSSPVQEIIDGDDRLCVGAALLVTKEHLTSTELKASAIRGLKKFVRMTFESETRHYYILFDSVDENLHKNLDTRRRDDLFATFFEGLLSFTRDFSKKESNPISDKVHLHLFLPTDIYNWSVDRHRDHLRQYHHSISWERNQLDEFITSRLAHNIQRELRSIQNASPQARKEAIWGAFLPQSISLEMYTPKRTYEISRGIGDHLIDMTLRRPRDLLEIMRHINERTCLSQLEFPTEKIVRAALDQYSLELKRSVAAEYDYVLPSIHDIFSRLAGNSPRFARNTILQIVGDCVGHDKEAVSRVMAILYEACVIGAVESVSRSGGIDGDLRWEADAPTRFCYDFPDFSSLEHSSYFEIHRAFWHALQLTSLRYG